MFYIPKYLWKAKEAKRLRQLINELRNKHITEISEYDRRRIVQDVVDSLLISKDYFYFFFFCEFLYFINLIAQIWFTVSLARLWKCLITFWSNPRLTHSLPF